MPEDRPFKTNDIIALGDQRGTAIRDEMNGFVLVTVSQRDETWSAEDCELAYRRVGPAAT